MKEQLKEYYCFNDYVMECVELKGEVAFLKGKKYLFNNQMIAKSELFGEHDLSDEIDFDRYFILQSEWDLLQQKSGKLPKQQLRTEAEKFVESILAYPTQINFTKSELTQYLLDFHAQQSKERDDLIEAKETIEHAIKIIERLLSGKSIKNLDEILADYKRISKSL